MLHNITPLRFFLALLVVMYHIPKLCKNQGLPYFLDLPIFQRGTEAVYMFFVLSGFLIIRMIYQEKKHTTFSIQNFYMRRILRIFPLYYLIAIFGFIFYHGILPSLNIPFEVNYDLKKGILMTCFFLVNIFTECDPGGILKVLWSLSVEEQFYLFIAPLLAIISTNKMLKVLSALLLTYFVVYHLDYFKTLQVYHFDYFYMLSGGLIAILEEEKKLNWLKTPFTSFIIIFTTILFFTTNILYFENEIIKNLIICMLFSLFILIISRKDIQYNVKNKILDHLGNISYGIYMYHIIVLNFIVFVFQKIDFKLNDSAVIVLINISTILITITVSHVSYKYYEMFFLKLKSKYKNNPTTN